MLWQVLLCWGKKSHRHYMETLQLEVQTLLLVDQWWLTSDGVCWSVWQRSLTPFPLTAERHWPPKDPRYWKSCGKKSPCEGWRHMSSSDGQLLFIPKPARISAFNMCMSWLILNTWKTKNSLHYLQHDFCCEYWSEDDISIGQHLKMAHYLC